MSDRGSEVYVTRSHVSSSASRKSVSSAAIATARAKAEAAKVRAAFAEQELKLKTEKARLEADLAKLAVDTEAAAAEAEVQALEEAARSDSKSFRLRLGPELSHRDISQRTSDYVLKHTASDDHLHSAPRERLNPAIQPSTFIQQTSHVKHEGNSVHLTPSVSPAPKFVDSYYTANRPKMEDPDGDYHGDNVFDGNNNSLGPHHSNMYQDHPLRNQELPDFLKFFARRELLTKGLLKFNDRPESYRAWRASFRNATAGLDISANEEIDLLVKWLGNESAEHAKRIRDISINHPSKGLCLLWERLDECYGSSERIEESLFKRLEDFPKISNKSFHMLRELSDLLVELQVAKFEGDLPGLASLDAARGIKPIVNKLPYSLQEKWLNRGSDYKQRHNVPFPPFHVFVDFVRQQAKIRNDPSFDLSTADLINPRTGKPAPVRNPRGSPITVHKTNVSATDSSRKTHSTTEPEGSLTIDPDKECPLHKRPHPLQQCRSFRGKSLKDRRIFLRENNICYRCCASTSHLARDCNASITCSECNSQEHSTALHPEPAPQNSTHIDRLTEHGGEETDSTPPEVSPQCTQVCGEGLTNKSCSKICLVTVYPMGYREKAVKLYAILDDQSNRSLASSAFFDIFGIKGLSCSYSLKTCTGVSEESGRRATGYQIESLDGKTSLPLPTLIECNAIPNNREEIPTPEAALHHPHLRNIAHLIPALNSQAKLVLLLGRDIIRVHKVRKQINGPHNSPYAQKLDLGWVVIGDVCLGNAHKPNNVHSLYTNTLESGRPSFFLPCPNKFLVKENLTNSAHLNGGKDRYAMDELCDGDKDHLGCAVFQKTKEDYKLAHSIEDETFLEIMDQGFHKDENDSWVAPLPFKPQRPRLPNNKELALKRLTYLKRTFLKKPEMELHFFAFMDKIFKNGHAEVAPPLKENNECWYLPTFGVYHPKKPGQIRVVFDSSSRYQGLSLNDVLLTGPDLNNSLIGVLIRFRKEAVAITADIQQMFHCFLVNEEHRDFLRFLWFRDNEPTKDIVEYRMKVHVFGNSPSPAIAIYGLKRSVQGSEKDVDEDVKQFIERDFYVDDGLKSLPSPQAAISLLKRTQNALACSNLRLHKIASNSKTVMEAFSVEDYAMDLKDLDLSTDSLPVQRSLGLNWDLKYDTFTFQVALEQKPFTRRGVLSTINSLYDPLGFAAPVIIQGKILLRELMVGSVDWDTPLSPGKEIAWVTWRDSLKTLSDLHIHRPYMCIPSEKVLSRKLCIFSDASVKAIAAVAYLKTIDVMGNVHIGFVMGKAKLTPCPESTIPRLELCAAVLATELAELITSELDLQLEDAEFFTDSKVVLGYIHNETRRFYVYINNRVLRIRKSSQPSQWRYVPTDQNPADHATRAVPASRLKDTNWLVGPALLYQPVPTAHETHTHELFEPESDVELRPQVSTLSTTITNRHLDSSRFLRFSTWRSAYRALTCLIHVIRSFKNRQSRPAPCKGWHRCHKAYTVEELTQAKHAIICCVQHEAYTQTLESLRNHRSVPKDSPLKKLDLFVDTQGLLRVGGRISNAKLENDECTPIIVPHGHVAFLLVEHYHAQVRHQGRLITEGALREAGFWIRGAKRLVSRVIFKCIICRKLRGSCQSQKMADLPADRLSTEPPFTNVGLDVFGPWSVVTRQTRGGHANSKRWAVLFTCLSIRAVHIEVIETMDTSSFINAFRRFISLRGHVKHIRSDRGSNFVGACGELKIPSNLDINQVERRLSELGCTWTFNPPHSSHMGGVWERMIGIARRILDSIFLQLGPSKLTHETLTTFMAEVVAIMNARPLVPISNDPDDLSLLTPSTLLTQKFNVSMPTSGEFTTKDLYKSQWKRVQMLADLFWTKWRKQYLSTLQTRDKWQDSRPNMKPGNVVLVKNTQSKRNEWPLGLVTKVFPSQDGQVRKVEIKIPKQSGKLFLRPVSELILLL
ncbi:uncharacterized protein ACNLHF_015817 isoform 1-T1 [Anomaloglossus baeobatrachus]|uniref:uncharacterized protein LOC142303206 n=1 Tax=Anomaloglossus baeobatrachus TaxID=238106 RepID=UPI003F4F9C1C